MDREMTPLGALELVCGELFDRWDKDMRSGKLLTALSGSMSPGYDPRVDLIRSALSTPSPDSGERMREAGEVERLRKALANTTAIVRLQNGNLHSDINEILAQADAALQESAR